MRSWRIGSAWLIDILHRYRAMTNLRPLTRVDLPALLDLLLAANRADSIDTPETLADIEHEFDDPWSYPERDAVVVAGPKGTLAGFARLFVNPRPNPDPESAAFLVLTVHPEQRDQGLETCLLDWLEARGRERLRGTTTRRLRIARPDHLKPDVERLLGRGYSPIRFYFRMGRDLHSPPGLTIPPGIKLRTYAPEWADQLWAAHAAAFSDHWGYVIESHDEFQEFVLGSANFRPDLSLLACAGAEVAAYAINRVHAEHNARTGVLEGVIGLIGTQRAWRGQGLATALIGESLRRFADAGLERATLTVDAENTTGALGLYERLGFAVGKRVQALDLVLSAD